MPKRSLPIYLDVELWNELDTVIAQAQADGVDVSRSRWVEAAIRRALASTEPLQIRPSPAKSFPLKKIKPPLNPTPGAGERVNLAVEPATVPIEKPPAETKITELMEKLDESVREAHEARARHEPAEEVAGPFPPAAPPGPPERPQRARVPSMAEHLALNPQLAANDFDSHMALNPDLAGTPIDLDVPPPTGTAVADFSLEPTLPPEAIERLKDETGPNPVVVHAVTVTYEKVDGKWCWACPDAGITGVSRFVADIRADAWEILTAYYGHDNLTLGVQRKP